MADWRKIGKQANYVLQATLLGTYLGFCRILPVDWASALGGWVGRTIGPRMGQNRKAARNLARAFPENSPEENRRIMRDMWDNLGRTIAEYPHLPRICARLQGGRVEVVGLDTLYAVRDSGKAAILFGAHLANWEVPPYLSRHAGMPLSFVYRAPNNPWVDRLIRRLRDAPGLFRKGEEGARALVRTLRKNGHIAILIDQKMNDGIAVPFFGRDAMTAPAIAQFALRFGCTLLPVRTERLKGARFRITVYPPLEIEPTGSREKDEYEVMLRINKMVEDWVRAKPEQWLWLHRRWPD